MSAPDTTEYEHPAPGPLAASSEPGSNSSSMPGGGYWAGGSPMVPYHMMHHSHHPFPHHLPPPPTYPMHHWPTAPPTPGSGSSSAGAAAPNYPPPPPPPHMMHPYHHHHYMMMMHPHLMHPYHPHHMMMMQDPSGSDYPSSPSPIKYRRSVMTPNNYDMLTTADSPAPAESPSASGIKFHKDSKHQLAGQYRTGRWSLDEKLVFLYALQKFGKGKWKKASAYLPQRSLIQIKSHAQKVLKRKEAGEDVFSRLEDNKARLDLLLARAHARLGGEPPSLLPPPPKRKREGYESEDDDESKDGESEDDDNNNQEERDDKAKRTSQRVKLNKGETSDGNESDKEEEGDENEKPAGKHRSTFLEAASALCQLVSKDGEDRSAEDRIDTTATIGLAPTPMKSMAESSV